MFIWLLRNPASKPKKLNFDSITLNTNSAGSLCLSHTVQLSSPVVQSSGPAHCFHTPAHHYDCKPQLSVNTRWESPAAHKTSIRGKPPTHANTTCLISVLWAKKIVSPRPTSVFKAMRASGKDTTPHPQTTNRKTVHSNSVLHFRIHIRGEWYRVLCIPVLQWANTVVITINIALKVFVFLSLYVP